MASWGIQVAAAFALGESKDPITSLTLWRIMDDWTYLAFFAGALTSTGYLPQILKGLRTKRLEDVSLLMPAVLGIGMLLWLIYGLAREDPAIIVANVIGSSLTGILVLMKVRYDASSSRR
jgi:MtN3 and saliva related transmembrane protein